MAYSEEKYKQAIATLADQLVEMMKEDYDDEDMPDKEYLWEEVADNISTAQGDLDEELDAAYDRVIGSK